MKITIEINKGFTFGLAIVAGIIITFILIFFLTSFLEEFIDPFKDLITIGFVTINSFTLAFILALIFFIFYMKCIGDKFIGDKSK